MKPSYKKKGIAIFRLANSEYIVEARIPDELTPDPQEGYNPKIDINSLISQFPPHFIEDIPPKKVRCKGLYGIQNFSEELICHVFRFHCRSLDEVRAISKELLAKIPDLDPRLKSKIFGDEGDNFEFSPSSLDDDDDIEDLKEIFRVRSEVERVAFSLIIGSKAKEIKIEDVNRGKKPEDL